LVLAQSIAAAESVVAWYATWRKSTTFRTTSIGLYAHQTRSAAIPQAFHWNQLWAPTSQGTNFYCRPTLSLQSTRRTYTYTHVRDSGFKITFSLNTLFSSLFLFRLTLSQAPQALFKWGDGNWVMFIIIIIIIIIFQHCELVLRQHLPNRSILAPSFDVLEWQLASPLHSIIISRPSPSPLYRGVIHTPLLSVSFFFWGGIWFRILKMINSPV